MDLDSTYKTLRNGAEVLALQRAVQKNRALEEVAKALDAERAKIIAANKTDIENARAGGMKETLVDRLSLDDRRIDSISKALEQ